MRAYIAIAAWLVLVLVLAGAAQAESLTPADMAFEKGRLFAESARYERACAAFELSQRLDPQFGTLFNLAGCYVRLGKVVTARRLYRELSRTDSNQQRRAEAARLVTELEARVSTLRVRVPGDLQSSTFEVFVGDTEVTSLLDVDIPFDPGRYVVYAIVPGYRPFRREIYLHEKEVGLVEVALEREPAPSSKPAASARSESRLGAKLVVATGAGLLAFGAVASWRWHVNEQESDANGSPASADRAHLWGGVSAASFLIGAVTAATGGIMLLGSRDSGAVRVAPAAGAGSASVFVSGSF